MVAPTMAEMRKHGLFEDAKEKFENTSKSWKKRWWAVVCDIWDNFTRWQEKYDLNRDTMTIIKKVIKKVTKRKDIIYHNNIVEKVPITFAKGTKLCYLFKFFDSDGNLLFSKVGTTERAIVTRLKEEIRKYSKAFDVDQVIIESVIDCGEIPPEGAESVARGLFIQMNPTSYIKNDRFLGFDIPTKVFNDCVNNFLAGCLQAA